jgi:hypothetical protein
MRRFSILSLMAFVFVSAIGMAALRNANELWAGVMLTIVFIALATAVVGAMILRGGEQYASAGFAVFSGGYLAMTLGPGLDAPFKAHFGTTALLNYVQSKVAFASPSKAATVGTRIPAVTRRANLVQRIASLEETIGGTDNPTLVTLKKRLVDLDAATERQRVLIAAADQWRSILPGAVNAEQFFCVGHSLFALIMGMVGTVIARMFFARRERNDVPADDTTD